MSSARRLAAGVLGALLTVAGCAAAVPALADGAVRQAVDPARPVAGPARADFDHDGRGDLVIATPNYPTDRRTAAGAVAIVYGDGRRQSLTADDARDGAGRRVFSSSRDQFGSGLAFGHFYATAYTDLVVTTFRESPGMGSGLTIFRGGPGGLSTPGLFIPQTRVDPANGKAFSGFGFGVTAGDFNGDGVTDLAVAAHHLTIGGNANSGALFILPGSRGGLRLSNITRFDLGRTAAFGRPALANEFFGYGLAAGDFNGDGRSDLAVEDGETVAGVPGAGRIHLLYGSPSGLVAARQALDRGGKSQADTYFGLTLAAADLNGDGVDDLVAGTPFAAVRGMAQAGYVTVFSGVRGIGLRLGRTFDQGAAGLGGAAAGNMLGLGIATGHFDADRFADVAISAQGQTVARQKTAGVVVVLVGSATGLRSSERQLLTARTPSRNGYFGGGLAVVGGANGGPDRLAVASPLVSAGGVSGSGRVQILTTRAGRFSTLSAATFTLGDFPGLADTPAAGTGAFLFYPTPRSPVPAVSTMTG